MTNISAPLNPVCDYLVGSDGTMKDLIGGGFATITRVGPKTVDLLNGTIQDVADNKLAVRPRSDGAGGYEAIIEEPRINYLINSYGYLNDGNSWSGWLVTDPVGGITTKSLVTSMYGGGSLSQRIQYTGVSADVASSFVYSNGTSAGSFVAGDNVTVSIYLWGSNTGCAVDLRILPRDVSDVTIGSGIASSALTLSSVPKRFSLTMSNLPTGTDHIRFLIRVTGIDNTDTFDIKFQCAQVEKASFATSYIPTTTTSVTRPADVVTVPTTNWDVNSGTMFTIQNTPASQSTYSVSWNSGRTSQRIYVGANIGTKGWMATDGGVSTYAIGSAAPSGYAVFSGKWAVGQKLFAYTNGSPSAASSLDYVAPTGLLSTANIGSQISTGSVLNFINTGLQRITVYSSALSDSNITTVTNAIKNGPQTDTVPIADWIVQSNGTIKDSVGNLQGVCSRGTPRTVDRSADLGVLQDVQSKNYALNPTFIIDTNSDGIADSWIDNSSFTSATGTRLWSIVNDAIYGRVQRLQYIGIMTDSNKQVGLYELSTAANTFIEGDNVTLSAYLKNNGCSGVSFGMAVYARDVNDTTLLGSQISSVSPGASWTRCSVTYTNIPANSSRVRILIYVNNIDNGDIIDLSIANVQLEKGLSATDFETNSIAIKPRSDGKAGYEAIVEEARTNYALHSYFDIDTNSDGVADNWSINSNDSSVGVCTLEDGGVYGGKMQHLHLSVPASKTGKSFGIVCDSVVGSFTAGDSATASFYLKGSITGNCQMYIILYSYDSSGTYLSNSQTTVSLNSNWKRFTYTYASLPANTSQVKISAILQGINTGDTGDVYISAAQSEKGAFATSYIPTTKTTAIRNTDNIILPSSNWSGANGSMLVVANTPATVLQSTFIDWRKDANNYISFFANNGTSVRSQYKVGGVTYDSGSKTWNTYYSVVGFVYQQNMPLLTFENGNFQTGGLPILTSISPAIAVNLGSIGGSWAWNGAMQRLVVYDNAMSVSDLTNKYNMIKNGPTAIKTINGLDRWSVKAINSATSNMIRDIDSL